MKSGCINKDDFYDSRKDWVISFCKKIKSLSIGKIVSESKIVLYKLTLLCYIFNIP